MDQRKWAQDALIMSRCTTRPAGLLFPGDKLVIDVDYCTYRLNGLGWITGGLCADHSSNYPFSISSHRP